MLPRSAPSASPLGRRGQGLGAVASASMFLGRVALALVLMLHPLRREGARGGDPIPIAYPLDSAPGPLRQPGPRRLTVERLDPQARAWASSTVTASWSVRPPDMLSSTIASRHRGRGSVADQDEVDACSVGAGRAERRAFGARVARLIARSSRSQSVTLVRAVTPRLSGAAPRAPPARGVVVAASVRSDAHQHALGEVDARGEVLQLADASRSVRWSRWVASGASSPCPVRDRRCASRRGGRGELDGRAPSTARVRVGRAFPQ